MTFRNPDPLSGPGPFEVGRMGLGSRTRQANQRQGDANKMRAKYVFTPNSMSERRLREARQ